MSLTLPPEVGYRYVIQDEDREDTYEAEVSEIKSDGSLFRIINKRGNGWWFRKDGYAYASGRVISKLVADAGSSSPTEFEQLQARYKEIKEKMDGFTDH